MVDHQSKEHSHLGDEEIGFLHAERLAGIEVSGDVLALLERRQLSAEPRDCVGFDSIDQSVWCCCFVFSKSEKSKAERWIKQSK